MKQVNSPPPDIPPPASHPAGAGGRPYGLIGLAALVLAAPIAPVVVGGESVFDLPAGWRLGPLADAGLKQAAALWLALVLAADILLPVPSGPLLTLAGAAIGAPLTAAAGWLGLTAGGVAAFAAARRWGAPLVARLVARGDLALARASNRSAEAWLLASRPLPVLAEAAVLWAGLVGVPWRRFLPPLAAGNLLLAAFFAGLGQVAADRGWLLPALAAAVALPAPLLGWFARRGGRRRAHGNAPTTTSKP